MNEKCYLFRFSDYTTYEMKCGISLKDATYEMSKYTNTSSEIFRKALQGNNFGSDDTDIIYLYNYINPTHRIIDVYIIDTVVFPPKEVK